MRRVRRESKRRGKDSRRDETHSELMMMPSLPPLLLLLLLLLLGTAGRTALAAGTLRLAVMDWAGNYNDSSTVDDDITLPQSINFLLAAFMFNERRGDILPLLNSSTLLACDKNFSLVKYCDTMGDPRHVSVEIAKMSGQIDAVVGISTSNDGTYAAMTADVTQGVPLISHWAQSPRFAVKQDFPLFARTIASDEEYVSVFVPTLMRLGYTRACMIYHDTDSGPEFKASFEKLALQNNITISFFVFQSGEPDSMRSAMTLAKETGLTVMIYHGYLFDEIDHIAPLANELEMGNKHGKMWIFTYIDRFPTAEQLRADPDMRDLWYGSLRVDAQAVGDQKYVDVYMEKWKTEFFPRYGDAMNAYLPPTGNANDRMDCDNDPLEFEVTQHLFDETATQAFHVWWTTFDAVLALGMAMCEGNPTGPVPQGRDLVDRLLALDFVGFGGRVKFSPNGDREMSTITFVMQNFGPDEPGQNGTLPVVVGSWDPDNASWIIPNTSAFVFVQGEGLESLLPQYPIVSVEMNFLPTWLYGIACAVGAFLFLMCAFCSVWLIYNRKERVVINAQGPLMQLICLGCAVAVCSIFTLSVDDARVAEGFPLERVNGACMASPLLFSIGMQLALVAILGKTLRIYHVFANRTTAIVRIRSRHVLGWVFLVILLELAIAVAWIFVSPLRWYRFTVFADKFGQPIETVGICGGDVVAGTFAGVVFGLHGLALVAAAFAAYKVKDLPEEFQESNWLALAVLTCAQVFVIAAPAAAAVYTYAIGRYIFLTFLVILSVSSVLFFIFLPKIYFLYTGEFLWNVSRSSKNSANRLSKPRSDHSAGNNTPQPGSKSDLVDATPSNSKLALATSAGS